MKQPTDIWFDLHLGQIRTNEDGTINRQVIRVITSHLSSFNLLDDTGVISAGSSKELHNLLDSAINNIL